MTQHRSIMRSYALLWKHADYLGHLCHAQHYLLTAIMYRNAANRYRL